MFYGSLKFKVNWLGKRIWYANFKHNDEIVWRKLKPQEIENVLKECGNNRFMSTEFIMGRYVRNDYYTFYVTVHNKDVVMKHNSGLCLPLPLYDSATFKIKCKK